MGVFVGRFCPLHLGHEAVIRFMLDNAADSHLVVIGSSNAPFSLRHFFNYEDRRAFLLQVFPGLRIVGLPDYPTDSEWLLALDDILATAGFNPHVATYYGGCEEDVIFFEGKGRNIAIPFNRFDGSTPKISATEVRDALIHDRPLDGMLNPELHNYVRGLFHDKWEKFKRI